MSSKPSFDEIHTHFIQGRDQEAIGLLDRLLEADAKLGLTPVMINTLETLVAAYPEKPALRTRLASLYKQLQRVPEASAQLEILAQLEADDKGSASS